MYVNQFHHSPSVFCEWQFGHRYWRFSSRLSHPHSLMWSTSRISFCPDHVPSLWHLAHSYLRPASVNALLSVFVLALSFFDLTVRCSDQCFFREEVLPLFDAQPRKWDVSISYFSKRLFICVFELPDCCMPSLWQIWLTDTHSFANDSRTSFVYFRPAIQMILQVRKNSNQKLVVWFTGSHQAYPRCLRGATI